MQTNTSLAALLFILILSITACQPTVPPEPLAPVEPPFTYYGWIYVGYTAESADLARIRTYTNTGFAVLPVQVQILEGRGFENIIFLFNESAILDLLWKNEGRQLPGVDGALWYDQEIPEYRNKFFQAYRQYMQGLKDELLTAGVYNQVDIFYLADEPAMHRNIYLDQDFLDRYVAEFKQVFPDKLGAITFAQAWEPTTAAGSHYDPPAQLDLVILDPYFFAVELGLDEVSCDRDEIREWLYQGNSVSSIGWAKQFGKPILVAGDAQLKDGQPPKDCYLTEMYALLQEDPDIAGLLWFIYDKEYDEGGYIRGGGNDPHLVELIENLGR
ncbi:MAG: hypothetical protein HY869_12345 [Chloroflexi bacterium]|nr:hypothetical protein [Chloroflexota bacterium]